MRAGRWILLLWLCFTVRSSFIACSLPLWAGFDEYAHFARIEVLATQGREPSRATPFPQDIADSLARLPSDGIGMSFDEYWKRSETERAAGIPAPKETIYEAQQPPVFYWLFAALYRLTGALSMAERVIFLRLVCVLLTSAVVPIGFLIGRQALGDTRLAIGAAALIAVLPLPGYTATHVSNEALAIALGSAVVLLTLRRAFLPLAIALGLALLTKAYFLAFLPPVALLVFSPARKKAVAALAGASAMSAWWYWRTWLTTGSLTGHNILVQPSLGTILQAIPRFPLLKSVDYGWTTFIWLGHWSFIPVRSWMYRAMALLFLLSLCGVVYLLWKRRTEIALLSAFLATFAAACVYLGLGQFAAGASPMASGWYACCLTAAFAVLFLAGLETILPRRLKPAAAAVIAVAFTAIDLFGRHVYSMPYYAGMISRTPSGGLPAYRISDLANGGLLVMFDRLTLGKPAWLNSSVLYTLWAMYLVATAVAIAATVRSSAVRQRELLDSGQ